MYIKISENYIEGGGIGISVPAEAEVDIEKNRIIACGKAIEIRAPESLLGALGLRPDTPLDSLREVLSFIRSAPRTHPEIVAKATSAGLFGWLSAGADSTTLISGLASLYEHIPSILAVLPG